MYQDGRAMLHTFLVRHRRHVRHSNDDLESPFCVFDLAATVDVFLIDCEPLVVRFSAVGGMANPDRNTHQSLEIRWYRQHAVYCMKYKWTSMSDFFSAVMCGVRL